MGSNPSEPLVSVVTTVKNEEKHLAPLLESLLKQEPPFELILVDALSTDRTLAIARSYELRHPEMIRVASKYGSRGIGRNTGVAAARGDFVAFIDGDCVADSQWLHQLRQGFRSSDIVAGKTVAVGTPQFGSLDRVELFQKGSDVTFPSCNLGYRRSLFQALDGFDPRFITAEDIDLNLRAVQRGARILSVPEALVYHQMRATLARFLLQAFWNGYGRKQLTEKHGSLWGSYRVRRLLEGQRSVWAWARMVAALAGYATRVLMGAGGRLGSSARRAEPAARAGREDGRNDSRHPDKG